MFCLCIKAGRLSFSYIQDTVAWQVFHHLSLFLYLFPFIFKQRFSHKHLLDSYEWLDFTWFFFLICFLHHFFFLLHTTVYFIMILSSGLFSSFSYLCVAFSFCFSFVLPANDNQHTDGKPVPVSLSSLPSFTFQFPVLSCLTARYQTTHHPFITHLISRL